MIKVIFSDFDGVLRHWDNSRLRELEVELQLPEGFTFQYAFKPRQLVPAITGKITQGQWEDNVFNELKSKVSESQAHQLIQAWLASPSCIDEQLIFTYQRLFPSAQLALVTNATSRLDSDLKETILGEHFSMIYNSYVLGFAKPHVNFYKEILRLSQVKAEESLFIDDSLSHVEQANSMGFNAIHFKSEEQTTITLKTFSSV